MRLLPLRIEILSAGLVLIPTKGQNSHHNGSMCAPHSVTQGQMEWLNVRRANWNGLNQPRSIARPQSTA